MTHSIRNFPERVVILKAIHRGIDRVNDANPDKPPIDKAPTTKLFGSGPLDSLGIVNLIIAVEDDIKRELGIEIVVVEDMFEIDDHPLETVQSLADHVEKVLAEKRQSMQARD